MPLAGAGSTLLPRRDAAPTAHYVVDHRVCPAPKAGQFTCYAIVQAPAAKGTAHAYAVDQTGPAWAHGPSGGLTPQALATAYGYNAGLDRPGQTVAIVDWYDDPTVRADLNHFDAHYGLPAETTTTFRKVNQNGAASPLPTR